MNWKATLAATWLLAVTCAIAQAPETDSALNESVQSIRKPGLFNIELETTVYRPDGDGPFPVVVINHGKAGGDPRFQGRYQPAQQARYFLQRGYAVVVPMRQGFSFHTMFDQYTAAGGQARLVAFGKFGADAHSLFGARTGAAIRQPELNAFLASIGMPNQGRPEFARFGTRSSVPVPPPTGFAPLDDEVTVPHVRETGRAGYKLYLAKQMPRAFAIAPNGAWGWAKGGDDPLRRALFNCNRSDQGECRLYSVDDQVVWEAR